MNVLKSNKKQESAANVTINHSDLIIYVMVVNGPSSFFYFLHNL